MKISRSQLKQIIKEEIEEALGDREVLVRGFGKLTLNQIERRLVEMLQEAGEGAMKDPPDFYNLKTGMIQAFYEAYRLHKDEERIDEKKLTDAEYKKKKEIADAIKRDNPDMPEDKRYAIATDSAKKSAE